MPWKPSTNQEIKDLLEQELASWDELSRREFSRVAIEPRKLSYRRSAHDSFDEIWAVAALHSRVLFWDSVEEEFGVGQIQNDDSLGDYGTFGERLAWSFHRFLRQPKPQPSG